MKDLKVGDRVRAYGTSQGGALLGRSKGWLGVIASIMEDGWVNVDIPCKSYLTYTFHRMQLRKLKPKVKREPRRIWVSIHDNGHVGGAFSEYQLETYHRDKRELTEFVEVIK